MGKKKRPILSDEFLDELAKEINQLYGDPINKEDAAATSKGKKTSAV
ncbi:bacitracin ABC transporter ATP-binding protein [Niallia oryzisoli]